MRSLRYLNTILTVLAVLLTLNLWTAWTTTPGGDALSLAGESEAQGFSNAGAQRREMIELLKQANVQLEQTHSHLTSGELRVRVTTDEETDDQPQD